MAPPKQNDGEELTLSLADIEKEFKHYTDVFRGKSVLVDCAHSDIPNFWVFFSRKFDFLGLKRLIIPVYEEITPSYMLDLERDINADGLIDQKDVNIQPLHGTADIDDGEKERLYNAADIVIICHKFKTMSSYIEKAEQADKNWVALGGNLAVMSLPMFERFKAGKFFIGVNENTNKKFEDQYGNEKPVAALWYSSQPIPKYVPPLLLTKQYDKKAYPKYDNYDAINVDKVDDIPSDYDGVMGVPATFITKWNADQFDIVGTLYSPKPDSYNHGEPIVAGKRKYGRLLIQKKQS